MNAKGSCGEQEAGEGGGRAAAALAAGPPHPGPPCAGGVGGGCADPPLPYDGCRPNAPLPDAPLLSLPCSGLPLQAAKTTGVATSFQPSRAACRKPPILELCSMETQGRNNLARPTVPILDMQITRQEMHSIYRQTPCLLPRHRSRAADLLPAALSGCTGMLKPVVRALKGCGLASCRCGGFVHAHSSGRGWR